MKKQWIFVAALALALALILAAGLTQAQGPEPEEEVQPAGMTLENQQLRFVPPGQGIDRPRARSENLASGQQPAGEESVTADPNGLLNYQGRLLRNGSPYNGSIDITFGLYSHETDGSAWWEETQTVQVDDGLFNVMLGEVEPLDDVAVNFQSQQWLGVQPAGAASELTPRQPLGAVAYAMNLMPGATLMDNNTGGSYWTTFYVNAYDHPAIYALSHVDVGVRGMTYFTETAGIEGTGTNYDGKGVVGINYGDGSHGHGVVGSNWGDGGSCPWDDTECASGVYGEAPGDAYASFFYGENRSAIIAKIGPTSYYGLWVRTMAAPDGYGIWTDGESRFEDYVTFAGGKSGYVVDIALNDGKEPLEQGDVVAISGYDAPVVGNIPVVRVRKVSAANATGVIGVVDALYVPCEAMEPSEEGQGCGGFRPGVTTIQPGEYLSVVTLGAYKALKVDATSGPIRPGDLLATSASAGYAAKATPVTIQGMSFHAPGTVIGKALGALEEGSGVIPVFVSSR